MKKSRTFRIRANAIKIYYYMRAQIKIQTEEDESYILQRILEEGYNYIIDLQKQNKGIMFGSYNDKRYTIGGRLDLDFNKKLENIIKENQWKIQEGIEYLIYLSALSRLSEKEQEFFDMKDWKMFTYDIHT